MMRAALPLFAKPALRRLRRGARSLLLKAAQLCDPTGDLGALASVERLAFTPRALGEPLEGLRFLLLGLCQIGHMADPAAPLGCRVDHQLYDGAPWTPIPPVDPDAHDAVVVALPLRAILNEGYGEGFDLLHARPEWTPERAQAAFARCQAALAAQLERLHAAVPALPTFLFSFLEPSFSYLGALQPGRDLSHPAIFVRRLNEWLVEALEPYPNFHLFDLNEAFNMVGRLHLQDDGVASFSHAGIIGTFDDALDEGRLVPFVSNHHVYDVIGALPVLQAYVFRGLRDAVKIVRGADRVKLVIVDLDDTLWRGVAAEGEREGWERTEGWPLGFVEALLYFRKRGGLLAICSKNEKGPTLERFAAIWRDGLRIEDFASVQIGWGSKAEGVAAILQEVNVLPAQAVFIDDNPRELDEVATAFPDLRCMGGSHRDWRRILLRAPETQVEALTAESARRTELIQARIVREAEAPAAPADRAAWLRALELEARLWLIDDAGAPGFARALELLNKTNQFNTTGQRWTLGEMQAFLKGGGRMLALSARDRLVDNGLVGVALVRPGEVVQAVLSCRVFGLGLETALGAEATGWALRTAPEVRARWIDTGRNRTAHGFFEALGYGDDGQGLRTRAVPPSPDWIALARDGALEHAARSALVQA